MTYKSILAAVDYGNDAKQVLGKAAEVAGLNSAALRVVHVLEPVDVTGPYDLAPILPLEFESQMLSRAREFLQQLLDEQHIENAIAEVKLGSIKSVLFSVVEEHNIDLIVIGTHGRHGVGVLLGSTATSILHGTPCDVLAIRI